MKHRFDRRLAGGFARDARSEQSGLDLRITHRARVERSNQIARSAFGEPLGTERGEAGTARFYKKRRASTARLSGLRARAGRRPHRNVALAENRETPRFAAKLVSQSEERFEGRFGGGNRRGGRVSGARHARTISVDSAQTLSIGDTA